MRSLLRIVARLPGVAIVRRLVERIVTPTVRIALASINDTLLAHNHRITHAERSANEAVAATRDVERHMPAFLNAIASTNGTARLLRRELDVRQDEIDELRSRLADAEKRIAELAGDDVAPS